MQMEELRKKVNDIEYHDIKELRQEVQEIKIDLAKNNLLTEQNTDAMKKMSDTMDSVRETMVQMTSAIEYTSKTNQELAINLKQQNEKIDRLQTRQDIYDKNMEKVKKDIKTNDEKSKFDILLFLKNNLVGIIMGVGILSYLFLK